MKLYHATFSKLVKKIKKCGYLGHSPYKLYSDSDNQYVYLATDPGEAESYAEVAADDCENERLANMLEDDDIVIFEIDTENLDMNKLERDNNVIDGTTTYQYDGVIPYEYLKVYDITQDYEENEIEEKRKQYYNDKRMCKLAGIDNYAGEDFVVHNLNIVDKTVKSNDIHNLVKQYLSEYGVENDFQEVNELEDIVRTRLVNSGIKIVG